MIDVVLGLVRLLANIEFAVYLILGFFALSVVSILYLGNRRFFGGLSVHAPAMLTSLGITFTFIGVLRGLLDFDLDNIDEGITELLEGLKVAFVSSVLGISMAFIFRLVQLSVQAGEDSGADVVSAMRTGLKEVAQSIGGEGEDSLANRMLNLQTSFDNKLDYLTSSLQQFIQELVDKSTEALMQALADVINEFNVKITDQFGENLSRFNEAVGEFLDWQESNRKELQELTTSFTSIRESLDVSATRIQEIAEHTGKIPGQMEALERSQKIFEQEMEQLTSTLGSLAEMRVKAQEVLPTLETGLTGIMSTLQSTNAEAIDTVKSLVTEMQNLKNETSSSMSEARGLIDTVAEGLQKTISEAQQELKKTTEQSIADISMAISQLDNSMQEEVQRCVEVMGNNVTRITEEFVNQYERLAKDSRIATELRESMEQGLLKKVTAEVKKAVKATD